MNPGTARCWRRAVPRPAGRVPASPVDVTSPDTGVGRRNGQANWPHGEAAGHLDGQHPAVGMASDLARANRAPAHVRTTLRACALVSMSMSNATRSPSYARRRQARARRIARRSRGGRALSRCSRRPRRRRRTSRSR
jgi:hypothetical protein